MGLYFTKKEFAERKSKVIKQLENEGLDALLMFRQESMYWLTGYDTFGFVFFQCLVLTKKGEIILLTRAPDLRQAQNTSIIKDIRIWVDKDNSNPVKELKNILSELGLEKSNLGVEYESYGLTGRNAITLNNSLKNFAILKDKSELISYLRVIKSPTEVVYVQKAANLADKAMEAAWKQPS
jgi:Xaa-Pro dipeptidase